MSEPARRFLHPLWLLFALAVVGLPLSVMLWPSHPPPDRFGTIPDFAHLDQRGQPFSRQSMQGQIWVADFIFTRCPDVCPALTARMATLQPDLSAEEPVRLLSISVDPAYDTPERLTAYAEEFSADPALWTFVTGEEPAVYQTIEGFKQLVDIQRAQGKEVPDILHSDRFVLVDRDGDIRGFYRTDPEGLDALRADIRWLVRHPDED